MREPALHQSPRDPGISAAAHRQMTVRTVSSLAPTLVIRTALNALVRAPTRTWVAVGGSSQSTVGLRDGCGLAPSNQLQNEPPTSEGVAESLAAYLDL